MQMHSRTHCNDTGRVLVLRSCAF